MSAADSWNYRLLKRGYCSHVAVLRSQENQLYIQGVPYVILFHLFYIHERKAVLEFEHCIQYIGIVKTLNDIIATFKPQK